MGLFDIISGGSGGGSSDSDSGGGGSGSDSTTQDVLSNIPGYGGGDDNERRRNRPSRSSGGGSSSGSSGGGDPFDAIASVGQDVVDAGQDAVDAGQDAVDDFTGGGGSSGGGSSSGSSSRSSGPSRSSGGGSSSGSSGSSNAPRGARRAVEMDQSRSGGGSSNPLDDVVNAGQDAVNDVVNRVDESTTLDEQAGQAVNQVEDVADSITGGGSGSSGGSSGSSGGSSSGGNSQPSMGDFRQAEATTLDSGGSGSSGGSSSRSSGSGGGSSGSSNGSGGGGVLGGVANAVDSGVDTVTSTGQDAVDATASAGQDAVNTGQDVVDTGAEKVGQGVDTVQSTGRNVVEGGATLLDEGQDAVDQGAQAVGQGVDSVQSTGRSVEDSFNNRDFLSDDDLAIAASLGGAAVEGIKDGSSPDAWVEEYSGLIDDEVATDLVGGDGQDADFGGLLTPDEEARNRYLSEKYQEATETAAGDVRDALPGAAGDAGAVATEFVGESTNVFAMSNAAESGIEAAGNIPETAVEDPVGTASTVAGVGGVIVGGTAKSVAKNPVEAGGKAALGYATGTAFGRIAEKAGDAARSARVSRNADATVDFDSSDTGITSPRGESGDLPYYQDTGTGDPSAQAVAEVSERAADNPQGATSGLDTDSALFHGTQDDFGASVDVGEGASELPGT